jgi:hypothetical protein
MGRLYRLVSLRFDGQAWNIPTEDITEKIKPFLKGCSLSEIVIDRALAALGAEFALTSWRCEALNLLLLLACVVEQGHKL